MNRKILLIEPNYKNKYPPMGLMKLSTYYKMCGDEVRFYKGNLKDFAVTLICEDLVNHLTNIFSEVKWKIHYPCLFEFIKYGKSSKMEADIFNNELVFDTLKEYRKKYKDKEYFNKPRYDKVGITTLFTFYWDITIETINFAKHLCKNINDVMVGGIMSSLLPDEVFAETGIHPFVGQLNHPGDIDKDNEIIIDELPLDYSILEEIDYEYPAKNAYFSYMTRGCVNKCGFCAVPKLEPKYSNYIGLINNIKVTKERFGEQKDLLLLDNNVLASDCYYKIIDEIKECGFQKDAKCILDNEYEIVINNLKNGYNDRGYLKKVIKLYKKLITKVKNDDLIKEIYQVLEQNECLYDYTITKEKVLDLDDYFRPLFVKYFKNKKVKRIVDFNQGIDSRLITDEKMSKLSEINIEPLRIAFDHWELKDIYEKSVRIACNNGIKKLSNYLLYNFNDKPEDLYYRLKLNVDLCEELDASIYSFPMKYHPLFDKEFFKNRNYIGKNWNRKFIRAIQAILNSTKGKVGRGKEFFYEAFGSDVDQYIRILWMPEPFIIYRRKYDAKLRDKLKNRYNSYSSNDSDLANEWWMKFNSLSSDKLELAKKIIATNDFSNYEKKTTDPEILEVLSYYRITRDIAEEN